MDSKFCVNCEHYHRCCGCKMGCCAVEDQNIMTFDYHDEHNCHIPDKFKEIANSPSWRESAIDIAKAKRNVEVIKEELKE